MKAYLEMGNGILTLDHDERVDNLNTVSDILKFYLITPKLISSTPITIYGDLDDSFLSIMLKDTVTSSGKRIVRYEWTIYRNLES